MRKKIFNMLCVVMMCLTICSSNTPIYAAIDDIIEVDYRDEDNHIYYVKYKVIDEDKKEVELLQADPFTGKFVLPETIRSYDGKRYYKIVSIHDTAFYNNYDPTDVTSIMGSNIITIGKEAFLNSPNLDSIDFPLATTVDSFAFSGCYSLKNIHLPKVETVADNSFSYCYGLNILSLPSAKTIGVNAFKTSIYLKMVNLFNALR